MALNRVGPYTAVMLVLTGLPANLDAQIQRTPQSDGVVRYERTRTTGQPPAWWLTLYNLFNWQSSKHPFERSIAFLAGVSEYEYIIPNLEWVRTDLDQLRDYLLNKAGFDLVYEARDQIVTTNLIENYMMNRLPKEVVAEDRLLFYYSGHGADIEDGVGYMQFARARPGEFTSNEYLPVTRCENWSKRNKAKHILFLIDSCASGLGFSTKAGSPNAEAEWLNTLSGNGSRHVVTAGTDRERAFQVEVSRQQGYSVFTRALLESLASESNASPDRGFVLLDEVYADLRVRVGRFSSRGPGRTMTPRLWAIPRNEKDKGTFVFLNPGAKEPLASGTLQKLLAVVPKDPNQPAVSKPREEPPNPPGRVLRAGEAGKNPNDGMSYVWIPPGEFQMGCSKDDKWCDDDEKPPFKVTISLGFWLGETEVRQGAYQKVMKDNPSRFTGPWRPVVYVSWYEAKEYCEAVGGRLPTEAEWEYAARAGSNAARNVELDGANAWGLSNMLGSVSESTWEWVADWYQDDYYRRLPSPATDPKGPPRGESRVLRGGPSQHDTDWHYRVSNRDFARPERGDGQLGFRCALDVMP